LFLGSLLVSPFGLLSDLELSPRDLSVITGIAYLLLMLAGYYVLYRTRRNKGDADV
jgi:hypothetical protein